MSLLYVYVFISAALIPILDNFFDILRQPYSWWLVPVLFIGVFVGLVVVQLLVFAVMILITDVKKAPPRSVGFFRMLVKATVPILVKLAGVKVKTTGTELMPSDQRVMLVCNHQHDFDPVIIYSVFPDSKLSFIGKKEIYTEKPFIGKAMHRLLCLPIDRENDREAAKTIIRAIRLIKDDDASVCVFPEGYTSPSCELLPFRNGAFKIAVKSQAPIVVCAINNTRSIVKNLLRRRTVIDFRLLDVIYPEDYDGLHTNEIGEIIHNKMKSALKEMR